MSRCIFKRDMTTILRFSAIPAHSFTTRKADGVWLCILTAPDGVKNTAGDQRKYDCNDQCSPAAVIGAFVIPGFLRAVGGILAIGIHQDRLLVHLLDFAHHIIFFSTAQRMIPIFAVNFL